MLVVLHTKSKHSRSQRIQLRVNQVAQFGSSDWADYSFADDPAMSEIHFEFRCTPEGCFVRNLSKESTTQLNGEAIETAAVRSGDEIRAGETAFEVDIEGQLEPEPEAEAELPTGASGAQAVGAAASLVATCAFLELSKDILKLAETKPNEQALIAELAEQEHFLDALRIRAYLLPKRAAVWWGCICIQDVDEPLEPAQAAALDSALAWVTDPTEDHRRDAERLSNEADSQGPGGLIALSAFWSEGSIGAPDAPEVEADERLVCQGVAAALITAAHLGDAKKSKDRLRGFLEKGQVVADGKNPIPVAST